MDGSVSGSGDLVGLPGGDPVMGSDRAYGVVGMIVLIAMLLGVLFAFVELGLGRIHEHEAPKSEFEIASTVCLDGVRPRAVVIERRWVISAQEWEYRLLFSNKARVWRIESDVMRCSL